MTTPEEKIKGLMESVAAMNKDRDVLRMAATMANTGFLKDATSIVDRWEANDVTSNTQVVYDAAYLIYLGHAGQKTWDEVSLAFMEYLVADQGWSDAVARAKERNQEEKSDE